MDTILAAVSSVGFPIVITFYLLTRFQASMDHLSHELGDLVNELRRNHLAA